LVTGKVVDLTTKEPVGFGLIKIFYGKNIGSDTIRKFYDPILNKKDTFYVEHIYEYKRVDSTICNANGEFRIFLYRSGVYLISCKIKIDTLGYRHDFREEVVITNDSTFVELTPRVYCEYDKYRNLDSCPVCLKKDKLLIAEYGLPSLPVTVEDFEWEKKIYWIGDCSYDSLCHARWYCSRCKKLF
jgi:hypothetical protein